jgi:hypothetical protein
MDKRKINIETKDNITTTRNKFGTSYQHNSILARTREEFDPASERCSELLVEHNQGYDPNLLLNTFEKQIIKFCVLNKLPTKAEEYKIKHGNKSYPAKKHLWELLKKEHDHIIGAYQAGVCLFSIHCCRQYIEKEEVNSALAHALRLVDDFSKFIFSTVEPTLALGKSRQDKMIGSNIKLTNEQYSHCFVYFESLDKTKDGNRKLSKTEKWDYTKEYALKEFNVDITAGRLRKVHKDWSYA